MPVIKRSLKWLPVLYALFLIFAYANGVALGDILFHAPKTRTVIQSRPPISPHATLSQVNANIVGKPYVTSALSELPGYICSAWTNGASGHGWVVIRCMK